LREGDLGTIVLVHHGGQAFDVEFATMGGATVAGFALEFGSVRRFKDREVLHARDVARS